MLAVVTSFLVTLTLIPIVMRVFRSINFLDSPDKRKIHRVSTPSLGGIATFSGIIFTVFISISWIDIVNEKFFLGATILIFLLGIRDDLSSLKAYHKLGIQIFSAFLVVYLGGVKIHGLNGLFGISSFPWFFNEIFTLIVIVVMTNAFNLIDGIDGLAASIALIISLFLGWVTFQSGYLVDACLAFSLSGASLGFLLFNWYPSMIFMGDTGSMVFGFMLIILIIRFIAIPTLPSTITAPVSISLALFILPIYDTLRVLMIRFYTGVNLLSPDRNHIHHVLLKFGLTHEQSTISLVLYNIFMVSMIVIFPGIGELWLILIMTISTVGIGAILERKLMRREATRLAKIMPPDRELSKRHSSV